MDTEAADMTAEGGPAPEATPDELATADMTAVATDTNGAAPAEAVADTTADAPEAPEATSIAAPDEAPEAEASATPEAEADRSSARSSRAR